MFSSLPATLRSDARDLPIARRRRAGSLARGAHRGRTAGSARRKPGRRHDARTARAHAPHDRAINITVDNIFDPNDPDEDKALYRWANRVHVRTRPSVVENILLFKVGDTFVGRLLDESARTLRASGFIAEATVAPGSYDSATNSVDVNVVVRDSWSLALDLKLNHKGGKTSGESGFPTNNLLGTGKTLEISRESEIDRDHRPSAMRTTTCSAVAYG